MPPRRTPIAERIERHSVPEPNTGCVLWTGYANAAGYGRMGICRQGYAVHRIAYELARGPIRHGLALDHLCRTPSCINPDHLEPVTNRENLLRGNTLSGVNRRKKYCARGHEYSEANTYHWMRGDEWRRSNHRMCRTCHRERQRAYRALRRSVVGGGSDAANAA